jgi:hypothetical protein
LEHGSGGDHVGLPRQEFLGGAVGLVGIVVGDLSPAFRVATMGPGQLSQPVVPPGSHVLVRRGGPGNDRVAGGPGRDALTGASGDDVMISNDDSGKQGIDKVDGGGDEFDPGFDICLSGVGDEVVNCEQ